MSYSYQLHDDIADKIVQCISHEREVAMSVYIFGPLTISFG